MKTLLSSLLVLALPLSAAAATYEIDPAHASAGFSVEHMMVTDVDGAFSDVAGTIEFDPKKVAETRFDVVIKAASIDTNLDKRDEHLRGADFFDVEKHPTLTFKSKAIKNVGKNSFQVVGDLTIRGITKEVVLDVKSPMTEYKDPWGNTKIGFTAVGSINRKDFGLTWNQALETGGMLVGETVDLKVNIEAAKKQ